MFMIAYSTERKFELRLSCFGMGFSLSLASLWIDQRHGSMWRDSLIPECFRYILLR